MIHTSALALLALSVAACASGGRPRPGADGGVHLDAPTGTDAARLDASATDATATDAGGQDAPPMDAPAADGGSDGGRDGGRDAGMDSGPPGCTSAAMCSDGLICNGVERCTAGACGPGVPIACDDGIACTVDRCGEPGGACTFMPNNALCGGGMTCDAARGCIAMCAESPCRLVAPQCGCPGGQACVIDTTGARFCATAGTASTGQACTGAAGCRAGDLCIDIDPVGTTSLCSHFCTSDSGCAGGLCIVTLDDGSGGTLPGVTLCTHVCDPVTQTGCPTGAFCGIYQETAGAMRLLTDCSAPVGTGGQGATCFDDTDCRAGFACITGTCLHWCRYPAGTGCTAGYTCYAFMTPVIIGGTQYGVCDF